jgi:hypothetical protein
MDPLNPEHMQTLIDTGLIWHAAVPVEYKDMAAAALINDKIMASPEGLAAIPPDVLKQINEQRNQNGKPPLGPDTTPATVAPREMGQPVMDAAAPEPETPVDTAAEPTEEPPLA